jgi:hypothetical protein
MQTVIKIAAGLCFLFAGYVLLMTWQITRQEPPPTFTLNQKPSQAVALDFIAKYEALVQEAVKDTPGQSRDEVQWAKDAQKRAAIDGARIGAWRDSGITLFVAAGTDRLGVCLDALQVLHTWWMTAYPVNGAPSSEALRQKRELGVEAGRKSAACQAQIKSTL